MKRNRPLALLTLTGGLLRLYQLGTQSFWLDEVRTIFTAILPLGREMYHSSFSPPLYYWFLHFFLTLGQSETLLRLPSALAGVASIPLFHAVGRRFVGARPALAATVLFSLSPFHIWYSQEVSNYSILLLLYLISFLCCFRYLEKGKRADLAGSAVAMGGALWIQYATVFVLLAQALIVFYELRYDRRRLVSWLVCQGFLGLFLVLPLFLTHYLPGVEIWKTTNPFYLTVRPGSYLLFAVPYAFYAFLFGQSFGPALSELRRQSAFAAMRGYEAEIAAAVLVFGVIGICGLVAATRNKEVKRIALFLFLGVPTLLSLVYSGKYGIPLNPRYLIGVFPPYLMLLGLGWDHLPARAHLRKGFGLAALFLVAWSLHGLYWNPRYAREDARAAARFLENQVEPGDQVLVLSSYFAAFPMKYYAGDKLEIHSFSLHERVQEEALEQMLRDWQDVPRVWFVSSRYWENDPEGMVRERLTETRRECQRVVFPGVEVTAFCRR